VARIRMIAPEERLVPWIDRIVQPDEIVTVPDEHYDSYICQPAVWDPVEEPKPKPEPERSPAKTRASSAKDGE
jgi:hypothetical protein